jgi:hypothetical protein
MFRVNVALASRATMDVHGLTGDRVRLPSATATVPSTAGLPSRNVESQSVAPRNALHQEAAAGENMSLVLCAGSNWGRRDANFWTAPACRQRLPGDYQRRQQTRPGNNRPNHGLNPDQTHPCNCRNSIQSAGNYENHGETDSCASSTRDAAESFPSARSRVLCQWSQASRPIELLTP